MFGHFYFKNGTKTHFFSKRYLPMEFIFIKAHQINNKLTTSIKKTKTKTTEAPNVAPRDLLFGNG